MAAHTRRGLCLALQRVSLPPLGPRHHGTLRRVVAVHAVTELTIVFVWIVREGTDAAYLEEIQALATRLPGLRFQFHETVSDGVLRAENLEALADGGTIGQQWVLLCGPPMMRARSAQLIARGVRRSRTVSEEFALH